MAAKAEYLCALSRQAVQSQHNHELDMETFDERRIFQLKAQVIQLEKQIVVMANSISDHKEKILAAEAMVLQSADFLRSAIESQDNLSKSVTLSKAELESQVKKTRGLCEQLSSIQGEKYPLDSEIFVTNRKFLKDTDVMSLNELCSGNVRHINLSQVTKLEQRLATLYGHIVGLQHQVEGGTSAPLTDRLEQLKSELPEVCEDLLTLSLLVPNVPWSRRKALPEVTVDSLMAALPKLTAAKQQEVKSLMTTVLKLAEHRHQIQASKIDALEKELSFHRRQTKSSAKIVDESLECMLSQHQLYQKNLCDTLIQPFSDILDVFTQLADDPTDKTLKTFLSDFKGAAPQMKEVCETIQSHNVTTSGMTQLKSDYEKRMEKALAKLKLSQEKLEDQINENKNMEFETRDHLNAILPNPTTDNPSKKRRAKPSTKFPSIKSPVQNDSALSTSASSFISRLEQHSDMTENHSDCEECGETTLSREDDSGLGFSIQSTNISHRGHERKPKAITKNNLTSTASASNTAKPASTTAKEKTTPRNSKGARGVPMSTLRLVKNSNNDSKI